MGRHSTAGIATHPRLAAPSPHGKLSLDSFWQHLQGAEPLLDSSIHSLPFQKIQAGNKDKREEKGKGETIQK
jgi:hypothetical protein